MAMKPSTYMRSVLSSLLCCLLVATACQSAFADNGYTGTATASGVTLGGDVTGLANANTVSGIQGTALPSLSTGYLRWTGSTWVYSVVNLAGGSSFVTGALPAANLAPGTAGQALLTSSDGTTSTWTTLGGDLVCATGTPGSCIVNTLSFGSTLPVTSPTLQWLNTVASPAVTQAAKASTSGGNGSAGQTTTISAQAGQAATGASNNGGAGGTLALQAASGGTSGSATAGTQGFVNITNASGNLLQFGLLVGQSGSSFGAIYPGGVTPSNSNYAFFTNAAGSSTVVNSSTTLTLAAGANDLVLTAANVGFAQPAGGTGSTPFAWKTTAGAIACSTGGTQTISSAQSITPGLIVTTGTLTSNCILDFGTNGTTGFWIIDMSGATPGATFGIQFKNGSATATYTSASVLSGTLAMVWTHGSNTLAVNY